ncbi:putative CCC2-P-type ATPase [Jaminaea rosea]|uniref:P-type Cu(+) transporter n=1 Tax=Jaminaea rosea TaxID=1569628 RepID=A0A316UTK7_9BASI|nr:putative CCC2-P-type ATPase [Jaminaea rosea]PWN28138.1 putative CCC2-P-type ATPase [Jaminaea rosea]
MSAVDDASSPRNMLPDGQGGGAAMDRATATLRVEGMTCGACVESIESMLRKQPGILDVSVALLAERAVVDYAPSQWTVEKIVEEVEDVGFDAIVLSDVKVDSASKQTSSTQAAEQGDAAPAIEEATLSVYGMTCSACVASIESGVLELAGVQSCEVALATERAKVRYDAKQLGLRDIVERIEDAGFDVVLADDRDSTQLQSLSRVKEVTQWRQAFIASLTMAVPVFLISMVLPKWSVTRSILMWQPITQLYLTDVLCLALTIPVQFGVGRRFYRTAWKALKHRSATMDVLVVFGTTASFTYSAFSMLFGLFCSSTPEHMCGKPATFFDTSTMLITFVSFGRYLENAAKGKTSEALSRLISLAPTAAVIYTDGEKCSAEKRVPGELVQRGDYVKVVPGDRIPADGVVVRGSSTVDESVVTGESMPVTKRVGSPVIGGTVNGLGSFDFLVHRAGKDTSLSQIVRLVSEAQTSKAPIQAFADRIAGVFVPTVIGLGLLTFVSWMALAHLLGPDHLPQVFREEHATKFAVCLKLCISVVVVACPCALGLATPTAVMVGTGVGAQHGILIKGGGPLEASVKIRKVLFDKTGTLTRGKVAVVGVAWAGGPVTAHDEDLDAPVLGDEDGNRLTLRRRDALEMVGALEGKSEHPLGNAIAAYARRRCGIAEGTEGSTGLAVESFQSITGQGVTGTVRSNASSSHPHHLSIGNSRLFGGAGSSSKKEMVSPHLPPSLSTFAQVEEHLARTLVYVTLDSQVILALSLADQVRPEARRAIRALHSMGISTALVTGDTEATARAVARQVGIDDEHDVYASRTPQGKSELIQELRRDLALDPRGSEGGIAMVGDGINDSPALASADCGIALSSGSDIALESASIVLVRNSLLDVPSSLLLSRRIFLQIRLNFAWATCYNLVALPLAMGVGLPWGWKMHPMMAGAAMAASSVSVVGGSLTLKWWRRPRHLEGGADGEDGLVLESKKSAEDDDEDALDEYEAVGATRGRPGSAFVWLDSLASRAASLFSRRGDTRRGSLAGPAAATPTTAALSSSAQYQALPSVVVSGPEEDEAYEMA